ncbi:hypothetical protein GAYE_SCF18G3877 [Galdieria yellowstonensis]|jgi:threonine dehydratase|uniref:Threonine dehydratase n=1 Tax=Galdieria yellowstonensis TaxID=3028027 RepID=A0AAV9IF37_9RHOD|nr:hypothetical protein GAYE_SCF18G3877 [Galdieria yellowstonensis]
MELSRSLHSTLSFASTFVPSDCKTLRDEQNKYVHCGTFQNYNRFRGQKRPRRLSRNLWQLRGSFSQASRVPETGSNTHAAQSFNEHEPHQQNWVQDRYLEKVLVSRVYEVAIESRLTLAPSLSKRLSNNVFLKREDEQPVFSFKIRGAYNLMANTPSELLKNGVVAASAGNHAQGVALAASHLGIQSIIVMPETTPKIKVDAVKARGGIAVLHGDNFDEAKEFAQALVEEKGAFFVPPFDHPEVIAGQGTIGLELVRQMSGKPLHAVFVPVGGGGLIAGISSVLKRLRPEVKVVGVEPVDSDAMKQSLEAGERVILKQVGVFADGVAVKQVGKETFRLCQQYVDEVILVDTDEICAAIKDVFEDTRSVLEPAGALSIAGLKSYVERHKCSDLNLVAIASGANMNFDRLRYVSERAEIGEYREAVFAVTIPEEPGSFRKLIQVIGDCSVTEFNYRYAGHPKAHVFVGLSVTDKEGAHQALQRFHDAGYEALNLSENEVAKLHLRHLVGGKASGIKDELVFRFEFPERPGALMKFLMALRPDWNICLFHYRNHGTDVGRVLVGLQVPSEERAELKSSIDSLGYAAIEETNNVAYQLFLGNNEGF